MDRQSHDLLAAIRLARENVLDLDIVVNDRRRELELTLCTRGPAKRALRAAMRERDQAVDELQRLLVRAREELLVRTP